MVRYATLTAPYIILCFFIEGYAVRGKSPKSQKYRDFFKKHNINLDEHTIEISENLHKELHRAGNNWTTKWKRWIDENSDATTKDVYQQAGKMMDEYGVGNSRIKHYRKVDK